MKRKRVSHFEHALEVFDVEVLVVVVALVEEEIGRDAAERRGNTLIFVY